MNIDLDFIKKSTLDISVFNNSLDKRNIIDIISSRFIFSYGALDKKSNRIMATGLHEYKYHQSLKKIRTEFLIYGYAYIIGEDNYPYFGMDFSMVDLFIDKFMHLNFDGWITDRNFNVCIEFHHEGSFLVCSSPYNTIIKTIKSYYR